MTVLWLGGPSKCCGFDDLFFLLLCLDYPQLGSPGRRALMSAREAHTLSTRLLSSSQASVRTLFGFSLSGSWTSRKASTVAQEWPCGHSDQQEE